MIYLGSKARIVDEIPNSFQAVSLYPSARDYLFFLDDYFFLSFCIVFRKNLCIFAPAILMERKNHIA